MIKIAVLGYGTIGSGVVEVLETNREHITQTAGQEIEVKYVLDLRDFPGDPIQEKIVHDYEIIKNDPEIQIVVEAMGGVEPAYTFVKGALLEGKHVATSNKALVAKHGAELLEIAKEREINFLFEASVGGGIPIIRPLVTSLTADIVEEITGILNGTTNYMLTKMSTEGSDYNEVLKDAQAKGYAEADPTADVEGYDACRKIAILTSLVCGKTVDFEEIHTEGISKITPEDIAYAKAMGRSIKLLATSRGDGNGYYAMVAPFMLGEDHPLNNVNGVFNAIFVHGNMLGDAMFYGSGAGKLPTASAVVADVVEAAKHLHDTIPNNWSNEEMTLMEPDSVEGRYFVRVKDTSLDEVDKAFGKVEAVIEPDSLPEEFGFITRLMTQGEYKERVKALGENVLGMIRVKEAIVVEGKYDAARLSHLTDAMILLTDGFGIYKDKKRQQLLKALAKKNGLILFTDSDAAGFRIRTYITNLVGAEHVVQAYVPAIHGKEKRKPQPGKEGLLGVEGVDDAIVLQALKDALGPEADATAAPKPAGRAITYTDLYNWKLSGTPGSAERKYALLNALGLPPRLSKKELVEALNRLYSFEELDKLQAEILK